MHDHAPVRRCGQPRADLLALVEQARDRSRADPFGSPVLATALAIMRQMDAGA